MSEVEKAENLKPTWQQAESLELREKVLGPREVFVFLLFSWQPQPSQTRQKSSGSESY